MRIFRGLPEMETIRLLTILWVFSGGFVCYNSARMLVGLDSRVQIYGFTGVAIFGIIIALVQVATGVLAGRLIDRVGSLRGLFLGGMILIGACVLVLTPTSWPLLIAYTIALSLGSLFINVAAQKGVGETVSKEQRTRYFSSLSQLVALTNVAGPVSMGIVVGSFGMSAAYGLLALIAAAAIVPIPWTLRHCGTAISRTCQLSAPRMREQAVLSDLFTGHQSAVTICSGVLFASVTTFILATPIMATNNGLAPHEIGLVIGIYGVTAILSRLFTSRLCRAIGEEHLLSIGFVVAAAGFGCLAFAHQLPAFFTAAFLLGVGLGWGLPLTIILTHRNATEGQEGALLAMLVSINKLSEALVLVVVLLISGTRWIEAPFGINAALLVLSALINWYSLRERTNYGNF